MSRIIRVVSVILFCVAALPSVSAVAQDESPSSAEIDGDISSADSTNGLRLHTRLVVTKRQQGERAMLRDYGKMARRDRRDVDAFARIRRWSAGRMTAAQEREMETAAQRKAVAGGEVSASATSGCKGDSVTYVGENLVQQDLVKYSQYTYYCGNGSAITYVSCTPSFDANGLWNFNGHQTNCTDPAFFSGGIGFQSFAEVSQGAFSVLCYEDNCAQRVNPFIGHLGYGNGTLYEAKGEGVISPAWEGPIAPNGFPD